MWNGWLVGQPAGWLAGCLAASVENRPTPIHSSSLSSYVRVSLFIYMRKTRVWKMRVCVAPKKKRAEGWRRVTCSRVEERRRNEGGFRKEEIFQLALPSDQVEGNGRQVRSSQPCVFPSSIYTTRVYTHAFWSNRNLRSKYDTRCVLLNRNRRYRKYRGSGVLLNTSYCNAR